MPKVNITDFVWLRPFFYCIHIFFFKSTESLAFIVEHGFIIIWLLVGYQLGINKDDTCIDPRNYRSN